MNVASIDPAQLPIIVVAGPTASGKSALAIDVAEAFDGTVINADSMQVYSEINILSARPSAAEAARVPHRLFGVLSVAEPCSVARWLAMATDVIAETRDEGRLPVVVGGTGMYLRALTEGLAEVPEIPPEFRAEATDLLARLGGAAFRKMLAKRDPEAAARLPDGDSQRLIRAYEVVAGTGRTLADWHRQGNGLPPVPGRVLCIALIPERATLYAAIDERFDRMVADGGLDEVAALDRLGLDDDLPAMKAVGVRQLLPHVRGQCDLESAVAAAQQASRNYAKRQLTWLRHQMPGAVVINAQYSKRFQAKIFAIIRPFVLTKTP